MIGIYKITSPSNKIYIGQSTNIDKRWKQYENLNKYSIGPKLRNSIIKYGWDNHQKEILEECPNNYLNELEIWWKLFYNCVEDGLNCNYWDKGGGSMSKEVREKISLNGKGKSRNKGILKTIEHRKNISKGKLGKSINLKNRKYSQETIQKMSESKMGIKFNEEQKQKLRKPKKNKENYKENSNRLDKTIYTFYNEKELKTFTGIRSQFIKEYNLIDSNICNMIKNKKSINSVKGWKLYNKF